MGTHNALLYGKELYPCQHLLQTEGIMESKRSPGIFTGEKIQPEHTEIKK